MKPMKTNQSWRKILTFPRAVTARITSRMIRILGTKKNRLDRIRMRMRTANRATTKRTGDFRGESLSLNIRGRNIIGLAGSSQIPGPVGGLEKKEQRP